MIFRRDRKRSSQPEREEPAEAAAAEQDVDELGASAADAEASADAESTLDLATLDAQDWRSEGPWDVQEVDDLDAPDEPDEPDEQPRIDLGSIIVTAVPGAELRLQVSEENQQIVSAMLVMETAVEPAAGTGGQTQVYSSALELGAYAAPRSGGLWAELREDIAAAAIEAGGSAALAEGPFGVELRRLIPVTTPDGEEGYQPSRMWVAEGPRWLLRGIVYGQAAVEESEDSPVVAPVLTAFRQVVVRRGDEAMAPGDLLPLTMPVDLLAQEES